MYGYIISKSVDRPRIPKVRVILQLVLAPIDPTVDQLKNVLGEANHRVSTVNETL